MKTKLLVIGLALAAFLFWLTSTQKSFLTDVRSSATADVGLIELCTRSGQCNSLDRNDAVRFSEALKYLSQAEAKRPPGKTPIAKDRLIKIKMRGSVAGTFQHCFRLVEFVGVDEAYLNEIATDSECSGIEKYLSGYAAIDKLD